MDQLKFNNTSNLDFLFLKLRLLSGACGSQHSFCMWNNLFAGSQDRCGFSSLKCSGGDEKIII